MLSFFLEPDQIDIFIELCELSGADTKAKQEVVLLEMAKVGMIKSVTHVKTSKQEYIEHLRKNFGSVMEVTKENESNGNE